MPNDMIAIEIEPSDALEGALATVRRYVADIEGREGLACADVLAGCQATERDPARLAAFAVVLAAELLERHGWVKPEGAQACRQCGCWDERACLHEDGEPCHWAERDLCSRCVYA